MSVGPDNAILAAVAMAAQDAASRIQAATITANAAANADIAVANINAAAQESVASIENSGRTLMVQAQGAWEVDVANINAAAQESVATTDANARTTVATTQANAQTASAQLQSQAEITAAQSHANATTTAAASAAGATVTASQNDATARVQVAQIESSYQTSVATIGANAQTTVASTGASASNYKADQDLVGTKYSSDAETTRLNLKLAFANDKWNTLLPIVNSALGIVGGAVGSGSIGFHASADTREPLGFPPTVRAAFPVVMSEPDEIQVGHYSRRRAGLFDPIHMGSGDLKTGGIGFASGATVADAVAATQLPVISTAGALTPAQIQQLVNAAYARNDAKTASTTLALVEDMSGRGFSANSPILAALQVGLAGQNLRASIQAESQIRLDSAKLNADTITERQKNSSDQFLQQEQVLIESAKNDVTRTVGILTAISNLIGGAL